MQDARQVTVAAPVTLGSSASEQWRQAPEHLAMVLARYRAAAALIGSARTVLEFGCGEGIGSRLLASGREMYHGLDLDPDALAVAKRLGGGLIFSVTDVRRPGTFCGWDAVVALDVIEHLDDADALAMLASAVRALKGTGVLVVGTPSAGFDHLASKQSKLLHVRTFRHDELLALMEDHFRVVQSFGMQDTALHLGHPEARHYLIMAGITPR